MDRDRVSLLSRCAESVYHTISHYGTAIPEGLLSAQEQSVRGILNESLSRSCISHFIDLHLAGWTLAHGQRSWHGAGSLSRCPESVFHTPGSQSGTPSLQIRFDLLYSFHGKRIKDGSKTVRLCRYLLNIIRVIQFRKTQNQALL